MHFILSTLIKLVCDLPLLLLGLVIVPFALLFEKNNHLPFWAEWCWGNKDHGNDGEKFWAAKTVGQSRFWRCYQWLALRNPCFNWGKYILGTTFTSYEHVGDIKVGDKSGPGSYWCFMGPYWEYYSITPYTLFGTKRCLRIRFGWKIYGKAVGDECQFVWVINPVMPYFGT
jgi:hypothetical protein